MRYCNIKQNIVHKEKHNEMKGEQVLEARSKKRTESTILELYLLPKS